MWDKAEWVLVTYKTDLTIYLIVSAAAATASEHVHATLRFVLWRGLLLGKDGSLEGRMEEDG